MNSELIERIDSLFSAYTEGGKRSSSMSVIKILTDCRAALSEPVSVQQDVDEFIAEHGIKDEVWYGDVLSEHTYIDATDLRKFFSRSPSGCADLQCLLDARAFIVGEPVGAGRLTNVVSERDLRAWMAGHARVPVEPTHAIHYKERKMLNLQDWLDEHESPQNMQASFMYVRSDDVRELVNQIRREKAEPVSVQDVEEFIDLHDYDKEDMCSGCVPSSALREWMAGHARVPVYELADVLWLAENPARAREANSAARRSIIRCSKAMLTASKERTE